MLNKWLSGDTPRIITMAVVLVGVLFVLAGAALFVDASLKLPQNLSYQYRTSKQPATVTTETEGRMLMVSDLERRNLENQRSTAMVVSGVGLVFVSVGGMGYSFVNSRRPKPEMMKT